MIYRLREYKCRSGVEQSVTMLEIDSLLSEYYGKDSEGGEDTEERGIEQESIHSSGISFLLELGLALGFEMLRLGLEIKLVLELD
jgi:hypothetical protein